MYDNNNMKYPNLIGNVYNISRMQLLTLVWKSMNENFHTMTVGYCLSGVV